ncbi:hypothetical protein [Bradyrhizobium sp. UFLA03-84]|uniref:hypothetical protein n=1 Tax=Bradyrhizobium sp. UFLA03-84 TaxID=418599 RepID=UPI0013046B97|nr:hypothetical protein [Bradyrhizobium sp. UFLA03-84]
MHANKSASELVPAALAVPGSLAALAFEYADMFAGVHIQHGAHQFWLLAAAAGLDE